VAVESALRTRSDLKVATLCDRNRALYPSVGLWRLLQYPLNGRRIKGVYPSVEGYTQKCPCTALIARALAVFFSGAR